MKFNSTQLESLLPDGTTTLSGKKLILSKEESYGEITGRYIEADKYERILNRISLLNDDVLISPTSEAIHAAREIINTAIKQEVNIVTIGPTSDAGIYTTLAKNERVLVFDVYDDGEIVFIDESNPQSIARKIDLEFAVQIIESF